MKKEELKIKLKDLLKEMKRTGDTSSPKYYAFKIMLKNINKEDFFETIYKMIDKEILTLLEEKEKVNIEEEKPVDNKEFEERVNKVDRYINECNDLYNSKMNAMEEEIKKVEDWFKNRKDEIKAMVLLGKKIINATEKCNNFMVNKVRGTGSEHRLGFDINRDGYAEKEKEWEILGLTKKGGGFCGDWEIHISPNGKFTYTDRFKDVKTLDWQRYKTETVLELQKEFEDLKIKFYGFIDAL